MIPTDKKTKRDIDMQKESVFSEKERKKIHPPVKVLKMEMPLQYLKGVGPRLAGVFAKKNIHTVHDLIHFYPRTYRDQRTVRDVSQLMPNTYAAIYGYVVRKKVFTPGRRIYEVTIKSPGGWIACKYFRLPYRGYFDSIEIDQKVKVVGRVTHYRNQPEFHHPDIYPFKKDEDQTDALVPVYTEVGKVSQNKIRKMIATAFSGLKKNDDFFSFDPLPQWLKKEHNLMGRIEALEQVHQPDQKRVEDYLQYRAPAQKRLIFEEFFFLQLYMGMKRAGLKKEKTYSIPIRSENSGSYRKEKTEKLEQDQYIKSSVSLGDKLKKSLSFSLTAAQERVLKEVEQDMQRNYPMHRLIQGDVGCGKTIVAFLSCCAVIENGLQCAIMTPTEILAEQHYQNALSLLKPIGINVSLLTGKTRVREKRDILEKLMSGYTSLCIGTHALIQESVQFKKLGLVIVDEQHRFGVHQRGLLKAKGMHPHFLVMTATPIPRSLAMTLYGDLDVSVIDEMPKGRQLVVTKKTYGSKRDKVWSFLGSQIRQGRQAYIVYPLVEESEHFDLKNAVEEYERLKVIFPDFKLGLLHGRMSFFEKQEVMSDFLKGTVQILVSTTVIEVGVDVANASVMIVEHAERFGLSQLHQLRGRVGRGAYKSYCILVIAGGFSEEASSRLSIMEKNSDGFKIAEADLEIRGPGEFLGTRQSGLPEFRVASLVRDGRLLQQAKESALRTIQKDPMLNSSEHHLLKKEMEKFSSYLYPG